MTTKIRVFDSPEQILDWETSNCDRCKKGYANNSLQFKCNLEEDTYLLELDIKTALRIGFIGANNKRNWKCGEVEWTDEWMAEVDSGNTKEPNRFEVSIQEYPEVKA